ncbi:MAG: molybdopterin-binding protein [Eubacterium sp.]|nr:molybdopterin-binding protein [Eubacterium sp.]
MKLIRTEDAVGHVLCHDITQIIKGVTKDAVFRKGHVVREEDIPVLLSVGKEHLYVWEKDENMLHENEAAEILFKICAGENMHGSDVKEGKIELIADVDGLLKIDHEHLLAVNSLGEMMIASRHGNFAVRKGDKLAGTRIIPLIIEKEKMERAVEAAGENPIFEVKPFRQKKVGIVTTGSEVFKGRIKDTFGPVIKDKVAEFPTEVIGQIYVDDDKAHITEAIMKQIENGADLVICTGGMSVDPDDCTPGAIMNTGARIITYGAPVLPGAMMLVSYYEKEGKTIPILGLPGCVMYAKRTIFDLVLPRIMADDEITKEDIAALGEGGLCLNCDICTFPNCGFGK